MTSGPHKVGDTIALGALFRLTAAAGDKRANPPQPVVTIVDWVNVVVINQAAMTNVPAAAAYVGLWQYNWNTAGRPAGSYRAYYYDMTDPITFDIASSGSEEINLEALTDLDDLAGAGFVTGTDSNKILSDKADLANARLGTDADTYPISTETKKISSVTIAGAIANSLGDKASTAVTQTTAAAIAAAVWNALTASYATVNTFGKAIADILGFGAAPSATTIAAAVWDRLTSLHTLAGSFGKAVAQFLGLGSGNIAVSSNTGGADNLKIRDSVTLAPVSGCTVRWYLASDWSGGNIGASFVKGNWVTLTDGTNDRVPYIAAGSYTVVASKEGYITGTKAVTVS